MADDYGKGRTDTGQKKKPRRKFVGLAAKAKRRKQVSESRLAQRTGISARDRELKKMFNQLKKYFKEPKGGGKEESDKDKENKRKRFDFRFKSIPGQEYLLGGKKGGKAK